LPRRWFSTFSSLLESVRIFVGAIYQQKSFENIYTFPFLLKFLSSFSKNSYIPGQSQIHTNAHNNWIHNNLNNASTLTRPVNRYLSVSYCLLVLAEMFPRKCCTKLNLACSGVSAIFEVLASTPPQAALFLQKKTKKQERNYNMTFHRWTICYTWN